MFVYIYNYIYEHEAIQKPIYTHTYTVTHNVLHFLLKVNTPALIDLYIGGILRQGREAHSSYGQLIEMPCKCFPSYWFSKQ